MRPLDPSDNIRTTSFVNLFMTKETDIHLHTVMIVDAQLITRTFHTIDSSMMGNGVLHITLFVMFLVLLLLRSSDNISVTIGIFLLPTPTVSTHIFQCFRDLPVEF